MAKKPKLNKKLKARLKLLSDRLWRLNNLYWILNEQGDRIKFKLNGVQLVLYWAMWWLNIIPKSRQHGITTFIAIFMLDACVFNSNVRCGIIAHRLDDAKRILRDKIKFAYNNLPDDLKAGRSISKDDSYEVLFDNNSGIYVGTSMRSGTLQYLHISEYGKLCARMPIKAEEVKTGAMPTVHKGGMIFIESTAEGAYGDFYDMCIEAEKARQSGRKLTRLDYKIHTFVWHQKDSNTLTPEEAECIEVTEVYNLYFQKIERIFKKIINPGQRAWYVAQKKSLKHNMFKEHPSFFEEAFLASVEGAYYPAEMAQMREEGRICALPHDPSNLVHTVCDVGVGPNMPWLFFQLVGQKVHVINSFAIGKKEDVGGGAAYFRRRLNDYRDKYHYNYGEHFAPYDVKKREASTGQPIHVTFRQLGIALNTELRMEKSVLEGIERMRNILSRVWIDSEKCQDVISAWSAYHREWIDSNNCYSEHPKADVSSHWADTGRYMSKIIDEDLCGDRDSVTLAQVNAWHNKYRRTAV